MSRAKHRSSGLLIAIACLCFAASTVLGGWLEKIEDPVAMKKYLESFVTPPSSMIGTKRQMEAEGFTCSIRKDSAFKKHMRYLYCADQVERPQPALWEIAFEMSGNGTLTGEIAVIKTHPRKR